MEQIISAGLDQLGLTARVPKDAPARLAQYGQMLLEKNRIMNLTAIREPEGVARLHMLDCAALLKFCDFQGKTLIDVGTGAGFPGMVLKMLVPSLKVTLLDSLKKRLDWLQEVCGSLSLQSIQTLHARAEEQSLAEGFRDSFDFASARAVADLRILCELCLPYVKIGGSFLAMKSTGSDQEQAGRYPGLPHSRHGNYTPADYHSKDSSHPPGLSPAMGKNSKGAPLTGFPHKIPVNCKFFLKNPQKMVDGPQICDKLTVKIRRSLPWGR